MVRHILTIADLSKEEIIAVVDKAADIKAHPEKYAKAMDHKTLLMLFQKPSLRTRVSFEVGMTQMGGHGIFYSIADSPLGVKETYGDTGAVISRMVDIVMARVNKKEDVRQLAAASTIPIINALDDWAHPCQMLCDLLTMVEKKGRCVLDGKLKMAYCGDLKNNVTYDLMRMAAVVGYEIRVAGPSGEGFDIEPEVVAECTRLCQKSGGKVIVCKTAEEACTGVDVIYCDSWMSYTVPKSELEHRVATFMPFQVNAKMLSVAKPDMIFMNCLPAARGMEQTAEVIDGPHSIVFDEAENRLHSCKALMLFLLGIGFDNKKCCPCCPQACDCTCCAASAGTKKTKRYLVALGGNALLQAGEKGTFPEAQHNAEVTCEQLVRLILAGNELVVTHGNGPQVGAIKLQNQIAAEKVPDMPLHVCGSESQGYLGYLMQQTFCNVFTKHNIKKDVASVVTQVRVDAEDPAFKNPTKPIGRFYSKEEAEKLKAEGKTVVEDSGRGWRVVVASPMPLEVVEGAAIKTLVNAGSVVISTGGGGIPVMRNQQGMLVGVEAVIDKDLSAAVLGQMVEADALIILTDIDAAYLNYTSPSDRKRIAKMTLAEAEAHYNANQFAKGSMGPKVRAGMKFAKATGKPCIITALNKVLEALDGQCGTMITP